MAVTLERERYQCQSFVLIQCFWFSVLINFEHVFASWNTFLFEVIYKNTNFFFLINAVLNTCSKLTKKTPERRHNVVLVSLY